MGMSLSAAAREAQVHRATWTSVERAHQEQQDFTLGRIEATLRWAPGSVTRILEGGDPIEAGVSTTPDQVRQDSPAVEIINRWEADLVHDIERDRRLTPEQRVDLIRLTRQTAVQQRAEIQSAEQRAALEREAVEGRLRIVRDRRSA